MNNPTIVRVKCNFQGQQVLTRTGGKRNEQVSLLSFRGPQLPLIDAIVHVCATFMTKPYPPHQHNPFADEYRNSIKVYLNGTHIDPSTYESQLVAEGDQLSFTS